MLKASPTRRASSPPEEGYILVAVIFMLAILIISLAVAVPRVREDIQRDREVETMHRGKQYVRAIQLYYRQFGAYPPNLDALVKTNNIRYLRKKYIDPTTGKDEWKAIAFGQNKTPTAMGFFGQPLAGSTLAGTGPSGGNGIAGASPAGSAFGSSPGGGSIFGSSSPTASSPTTTASPASSTGPTGSTSPTTSPTGSTDTSGGSTSGGNSSAGSGTGTGLTGQTFGGGGIIGFSPMSPKQSILVFKKKNHYNEWEFTYDPAMEQMTSGGAGGAGGVGIGQPASGMSGGIGGGIGGSSFGSGSGFGSTSPSPTSPTSPTTPTTPAPQ